MNKMRKITVLLVMVLVMGVLAACGRTAQMKKYEETAERIEEMAELLEPSFDAAGYVKAIMDVGLKQDFAAFVEMGLGTEEEAAQLYEKGTSSEMLIFEQLGSALGGEGEITGKLQEGLVAGRKSLKYTVGEAMEQNDGSYLVYVTCEKMNFYTRMFGNIYGKGKSVDGRIGRCIRGRITNTV